MRNIFAVASGSAAGQVVVLVFAPLITRIYTPEAFGLQGVFLSLVAVLSPITALRYPMAIVTAESQDEALRLTRLSLLVAAVIAIIIGFVLMLGGETVLHLLGAEALGALILFLPLALFCVALQDVTDFQAARLGVFRLVGIVAVLQAVTTNLARVLGGLVAPFAATLVTITALAPALQSAMLRIGSRELRYPQSGLTWTQAKVLLVRYRDFPIYRMPTDVLNALSQSVPVLLLAALFSPAVAGLYVLTRSILNLPSNIVGAAVGNVLYARFAELSRERQPLLPLLLRATFALLVLAPAIVGLAWFAPWVFTFVFGEEWSEAGYYARWMSLWIAFMVINIPAVRVTPVIRRQYFSLIFNFSLLLVRVFAVLVAWLWYEDPIISVAFFSVLSASMILLHILIVTRFVIGFDRP